MAANGKSASGDHAFHNGDPGLSASNLISVQPPRREDLQPSYAKTLQGESEDAGTHGWYGWMSMMIRKAITIFKKLTQEQSTALARRLDFSEPFPAVSSARIHTNPFRKVMSDWSPNSADSIAPWIQAWSRSIHYPRS